MLSSWIVFKLKGLLIIDSDSTLYFYYNETKVVKLVQQNV